MNETNTHTMNYEITSKEPWDYEKGVIKSGPYLATVRIEKFAKNWEYWVSIYIEDEKVMWFVGTEPQKGMAKEAVLSQVREYFATARPESFNA